MSTRMSSCEQRTDQRSSAVFQGALGSESPVAAAVLDEAREPSVDLRAGAGRSRCCSKLAHGGATSTSTGSVRKFDWRVDDPRRGRIGHDRPVRPGGLALPALRVRSDFQAALLRLSRSSVAPRGADASRA